MLKFAYPFAAVLAAASIATAVTAQATPDDPDANDWDFIGELGQWAVPVASPSHAIQTAHDICSARRSGVPLSEVLKNLDANLGIGPEKVRIGVVAAEKHYCPEILHGG